MTTFRRPTHQRDARKSYCQADCEAGVRLRPTCNQQRATCNLQPSAASVRSAPPWPKICVLSVLRGRRSALWLKDQSNPVQPSPTQSNQVKPCLLGWRQLVATTSSSQTPQPRRSLPPSHSSFCWQAELRLRHFASVRSAPPWPKICVSSVLRGRRSAIGSALSYFKLI